MDVKTFAREVETHIRPATFPVAAKLLAADEPVPDKAKRPLRDMKVQIAICQAIAMARRYGWTVAVGAEDVNCVLTKTAFGLAPPRTAFRPANTSTWWWGRLRAPTSCRMLW